MARVRNQPATCPACDGEFIPKDRLAKVSTQVYCSSQCGAGMARYKIRRGSNRCGRCNAPRAGSSSPTYCRSCARIVEQIWKDKGSIFCARCKRPREQRTSHPSYCLACISIKNRERAPSETCSKCKGPRGESTHKSYCTPCQRAIAKTSKAAVKKYQPYCARCKKPRDGSHPGYCKACWTGPLREERFAAPCIRCGTEKDQRHEHWCKRCSKDVWLRRVYGITVDEWESRFAKQGGVCGICKGGPGETRDGKVREWHTDHDHETKVFRGVLCASCNTGIGHFGDDVVKLSAAIGYLEAGRDS
jgi:hypothetical protein